MRYLSISLLILLMLSSLSWSQTPHEPFHEKHFKPTGTISSKYNELMNGYDVTYYKLDINLTNSSAQISGTVTIKARVIVESLETIVFQLINQLTVSNIRLNGNDVDFLHQNNEVLVSLNNPIVSENYFIVEIDYSGLSTNNGNGLTNSIHSSWATPVTWTISESFHAKSWFPVKESLTDKADSADIYITVPENLTAVSNGLLKKVVNLENGKRRFEWETRYPIAYYLISATVADYQEYNIYCNPGGMTSPLLIQNFVYNVPGCLDYYKVGIDRTADFLEIFSDLFGLYPFSNEKYGHVLSPFGGGMEHQTISMMGGFSYTLVSHELAHMWFGDYVTCATWQDIWINEGFASYSEYLVREKQMLLNEAKTWMETAQSRALLEPNGSVYIPAQEATDESRIFNYNLSYKKGAVILHMLRYELNDEELFFNILREFLNRYGNSNATGADFLGVVNDLSGEDYQWFFDQWYYGFGYPRFTINYGRSGNNNYITISQESSAGGDNFFKTSMDIFTLEGEELSGTRYFISENPQTITYESPYAIDYITIDPDGWILKIVDEITTIPTNTNFGGITIGPNPFKDYLNITLPFYTEKAVINIYSYSGNLIHSEILTPNFKKISTKFLSRGLYIIKVEVPNGTQTFKLFKN